MIVSDGNETRGDVLRQARAIAESGVSIDVMPIVYDARAEIGRLRAALDDNKHDLLLLRAATDTSNLFDRIAGLNSQIGYDKSRLLDCWVAIQRLAPHGLLTQQQATYRVPTEYTSRSTRTLIAHCAGAALP